MKCADLSGTTIGREQIVSGSPDSMLKFIIEFKNEASAALLYLQPQQEKVV